MLGDASVAITVDAYAKWIPPEGEAQSAIGRVREFVIRTRPQGPAPPAAAPRPDAVAPEGA